MQSSRTSSVLTQKLAPLLQALNANPRLQWGFVAILLIGGISGVLHLNDALQSEKQSYLQLQEDRSELSRQLGNPREQIDRQISVVTAEQFLRNSLWQYNSAVTGQAEFDTWLKTTLSAAGVKNLQTTQPTYRRLDDPSTFDRNDDSMNPCSNLSECNMIELRSNVRFSFDPETIALALGALEAGDKALRIQQLSINSSERRVELVAQALAQIEPEPDAPSASENSVAAAQQPATEAAPSPTPAKKVEVQW